MIEDAVGLIDDIMKRSQQGTIDIMYVGGDSTCWQIGDDGVGPMWDDVATMVRARMNRRIEHFETMGLFPRIMILDGVSLYRQLRHRNEDAFHFCASHDDYQVFDGGKSRKVLAAELCVESMITSAKLAVLVFSVSLPAAQPSGKAA